MDNEKIKLSKEFMNYNLNFIIDNMKINVNHFTIETFEQVDGYDYHKHSSYELHYIKSGHGMVEFENEKYLLKPGNLYLCAPSTVHKQIVFNNHMIEYALRFDIEQLNITTNKTSMNESEQILSLLNNGSSKLINEKFEIEKLFERSFEEAIDKKPGYYIKLKQYILNIIIETARCFMPFLYDKYQPYSLPTRDLEMHRMDTINRYINDNISSSLTNKDIAIHVFLSERQLYRVIKKNTNLSTHQYIEIIRLNNVKEILQQKIMSLKTIAELFGYSSAFHLSTSFKKHTGISPREYVNNMKEEYIDVNI